jgi:type I restriction enzyme R subunit
VGVELDAIAAAQKFQRLALIGDAVEALIAPDERRRAFLRHSGATARAYKALLPDARAEPYLKPVATLHVLAEALRGKLGPVDISAVSARIEALLDARVEGAAITAPIIEGDRAEGRLDLSGIDFEALEALFRTKPKTAIAQAREAAEAKAHEMAAQNPARAHLVEKLEKLVDAYNAGAVDVERVFERLKELISELELERGRAAREGLSEQELAIFDLLTRPEPKLTKAQEVAVKKVARELVEKLQGLLKIDYWRLKPQARGAVEHEIRVTLNALPEEPYPQELWDEKVGAVWEFVFTRGDTASLGARVN